MKKLLLYSILSLVLLSPAFAPATANPNRNPIQEQILNAGINLGWANAVLDIRPVLTPADELFIAECLERAALHIQTAATMFLEPYQTDRRADGIDLRILERLNRYAQIRLEMTREERAFYIEQIWKTYRQSFQTTFMVSGRFNTDRTVGYKYAPNCDFFILDTGYHFGRAQIAAEVQGSQARGYQNGANGMMREAMRRGLSVGWDGYPYGPRTNVRKECCSFGTEAAWGQLPVFQATSPVELYRQNLPVLQGIVFNAVLPGDACGMAREDCARMYPESIPGGRDETGRLICVCPEGLEWDANRTRCVPVLAEDDDAVRCARDFPGSVPGGRDANGNLICVCPQGMEWNAYRTWCMESIPPPPPPDTPGCTLRTNLMSGSSDFCTTFVEYHDPAGNVKTVHIVNDERFQQGFQAPSTWNHARYNTCEILFNDESAVCQAQPDPQPTGCTLHTERMAGSSDFCTSFVEYHDAAGQVRSVYIVNDQQFQQGFQVPSTWNRGRYNTCEILFHDESQVCQ